MGIEVLKNLLQFGFRWRIFCSFLLAITLVSCSILAATGNSKGRTLSDFSFLQIGMSYQTIIDEVGEADRDIGSGTYLKVYDLQDGKQIILSFVNLDNLTAAYLYYPETDQHQLFLEE
jgi:hypothetical protein